MKIIQIFLLVLIITGLALILTQKLWVPSITSFILSYEKSPWTVSDDIKVSTTTSNTKMTSPPSHWKQYENIEFGFSIKYPDEYVLQDSKTTLSDSSWKTISIMSVQNPKSSQIGEFQVSPISFTVSRQPTISGGEIYHTIKAYEAYREKMKYIDSSATNPKGEIVNLNGQDAFYLEYPPSDTTTVTSKSFDVIKNDLIYHISLNADDTYYDEILKNITFK